VLNRWRRHESSVGSRTSGSGIRQPRLLALGGVTPKRVASTVATQNQWTVEATHADLYCPEGRRDRGRVVLDERCAASSFTMSVRTMRVHVRSSVLYSRTGAMHSA